MHVFAHVVLNEILTVQLPLGVIKSIKEDVARTARSAELEASEQYPRRRPHIHRGRR